MTTAVREARVTCTDVMGSVWLTKAKGLPDALAGGNPVFGGGYRESA